MVFPINGRACQAHRRRELRRFYQHGYCTVREAVEELTEGYSPLVDLQFVRVPGSTLVEGPETLCLASTNFLYFSRMHI
jgi:hypothetical protein